MYLSVIVTLTITYLGTYLPTHPWTNLPVVVSVTLHLKHESGFRNCMRLHCIACKVVKQHSHDFEQTNHVLRQPLYALQTLPAK